MVKQLKTRKQKMDFLESAKKYRDVRQRAVNARILTKRGCLAEHIYSMTRHLGLTWHYLIESDLPANCIQDLQQLNQELRDCEFIRIGRLQYQEALYAQIQFFALEVEKVVEMMQHSYAPDLAEEFGKLIHKIRKIQLMATTMVAKSRVKYGQLLEEHESLMVNMGFSKEDIQADLQPGWRFGPINRGITSQELQLQWDLQREQ